ncbi:hypothetical protein ACQCVP_01515 [Rossellomorea vietnamensis]
MTETNLALPFIPQAESHLVAGMIKYLSSGFRIKACQQLLLTGWSPHRSFRLGIQTNES